MDHRPPLIGRHSLFRINLAGSNSAEASAGLFRPRVPPEPPLPPLDGVTRAPPTPQNNNNKHRNGVAVIIRYDQHDFYLSEFISILASGGDAIRPASFVAAESIFYRWWSRQRPYEVEG